MLPRNADADTLLVAMMRRRQRERMSAPEDWKTGLASIQFTLSSSRAAKLAHYRADKGLSIAEEHQRFVKVVKRIINSRETCCHASLDDHHCSRLIDIKDRHAIDGAARIRSRRGIRHVVGANDQSDIGLRKVPVDDVHFKELVVGDVGLGEQHVHVAGHASGNRVNAETYINTAL